jgi:hypothetical protein
VLSQVLKTAITSFGDEATPTVASAPSPSGRVSTLDADLQFTPRHCAVPARTPAVGATADRPAAPLRSRGTGIDLT